MATTAVQREKARMRLTARTSAIDEPSGRSILPPRAARCACVAAARTFLLCSLEVTLTSSDDAGERAAYGSFLEAHPEYAGTRALDDLRASDYSRLDAAGHAYLDYTGGGLHADSQVRRHADLLQHHV